MRGANGLGGAIAGCSALITNFTSLRILVRLNGRRRSISLVRRIRDKLLTFRGSLTRLHLAALLANRCSGGGTIVAFRTNTNNARTVS